MHRHKSLITILVVLAIFIFHTGCDRARKSDNQSNTPEWKRTMNAISGDEIKKTQQIKSLASRASGDFILSILKKLPDKEKVKVAGIILALNEPYMIAQLQQIVKQFKNPRILESAEWKRIWDAYMNDEEPPKTVDGRLHTLPGAPGHYIEPEKNEQIELNRWWDKFKQNKISAKDLAKWAINQNPNVKYALILKIKHKNKPQLLPVLELLAFDNDELIAREAIISIGLTGKLYGIKFLSGFIANENIAEDRRVFAAEVVIATIKNAHKLKKEQEVSP